MGAVNNDSLKCEIKSWLKVALDSKKFGDFLIELDGSTEKGDGYLGDVFFVTLTTYEKQIYKLVLKCSKRSVALRESTPAMTAVYLNEIYMYQTVFPAFRQFELERGIKEPFDSVPHYFGSYIGENIEVLVLENLKARGYLLYDRMKPLNSEHLIKVVREYGKYHAISVAFQDQNVKEFEKIRSGLNCTMEEFKKTTNMHDFYDPGVNQVCAELKDELEPNILEKWKTLIDKIDYIFGDLYFNTDNTLCVISHGDCWNNNFMYYYDENKSLSKMAILDWQMSYFTSPITDLSYFLFSTISEEGLNELDSILKEYHRSFSEHLQALGSDPQKLYPYEQFLLDWKKYCCFGLLTVNLILKICLTDKADVKGIEEVVENGQKVEDVFNYEVNDKQAFRRRVKPIVRYAVEKDLI